MYSLFVSVRTFKPDYNLNLLRLTSIASERCLQWCLRLFDFAYTAKTVACLPVQLERPRRTARAHCKRLRDIRIARLTARTMYLVPTN